jgi:hypothetical protein
MSLEYGLSKRRLKMIACNPKVEGNRERKGQNMGGCNREGRGRIWEDGQREVKKMGGGKRVLKEEGEGRGIFQELE